MLDGAKEQQRAEWRDWGVRRAWRLCWERVAAWHLMWIQERCEARGQKGLQLVH
jgi:hypothetical protein